MGGVGRGQYLVGDLQQGVAGWGQCVGWGRFLVGDLQQGVAGWGQCVGWCWEGAVPCR